jgi:CheY-like chemotaxis protein
LNNAIKFTSTGSIGLHVARADNNQRMLTFSVSDTGPGIAADELDMLGGAFIQAQAGITAKEGTGLGLAISSSFVRLMGGSGLKFSSRPDEGTTIAFSLPVQVPDAVAPTAAEAEPAVVGLAPGQRCCRILVADDQAESRQLLTRMLSPLGHEVREAENGEAALRIWDEWSPQLIWMDMRMPVMDGREATRRVKATGKGKATIIIALTASSFDDERDQIIADGCDDFLRKPFRDADLFDMMRKHLDMEFIYEGTEEANMEPVSIAGMPIELRAQLRQALEELDADAVEAVIEQIRDYDETLANTLEQMAYRYEYDRMRELVAQQATAFG